MTYQADMFSTDAPDVLLVTQDNVLVLRHPSMHTKGAEAAEEMGMTEDDAEKSFMSNLKITSVPMLTSGEAA